MGKKIGIDLGTTNSAMAYVEDGEPEMIENFEGKETTPSVVQISEDDRLVGETALNNAIRKPDEVVRRIKDHMSEAGEYTVEIGGKDYRPDEISSYIIEKLKHNAEEKLGEEVDSAVITVPYYFGEAAREATRNAAEFADLDVIRVMNEPTAACYAHGYDEDREGTALVYDLGGGTFDATLVDISPEAIEVVGTEGDHDLGGETFDDELYDYVAEQFVEEGHPDPEEHPHVKEDLRQNVRDAKEDLSFANTTDIVVMSGTEPFELELTRETFNEITGNLVEQTINTIDDLFSDENVSANPEDVDDILLVGGSTRIPLVQERVEDYFGKTPSMQGSPDKAVAQGAALEAAMYDEDAAEDVKTLPPVFDVLSHSLGVETYEANGSNEFDTILQKNQEVPADKRKTNYTTSVDNQTVIHVNVLEGEGETVDDEEVEVIGEFELSGIDPKPAGEPRLGVTFDVTEDGILTAEAEDLETGKTAETTITTIGLSEHEKEELKDERVPFSERE